MASFRLSRSQIDLYILNKIKQGYVLSYQGKTRVLTRGSEQIFISITRNGWCKVT